MMTVSQFYCFLTIELSAFSKNALRQNEKEYLVAETEADMWLGIQKIDKEISEMTDVWAKKQFELIRSGLKRNLIQLLLCFKSLCAWFPPIDASAKRWLWHAHMFCSWVHRPPSPDGKTHRCLLYVFINLNCLCFSFDGHDEEKFEVDTFNLVVDPLPY